MFKLNVNKKILLFIHIPSDEIEYAIYSSRKIIKHGICNLEQLEQIAKKEKVKYARVSFLTELSYFDKTTVRVKSRKFIDLAVKKYINDQAVFVDPFIFRAKLLKSADQQIVGLCAIPENDVQFFDKLKEIFIVERLIPLEAAVFSLSKRINKKARNVIWIHNDLKISLTVEDNFIVDKNVSSYVSEVESYSEDEIVFDENNHPLAHFEGLLYADKECDFLPKEYVRDIIFYKTAKISFAFSVGASALLLLLSYSDYARYSNLLSEFRIKSSRLNSEISYISSHMPSQSELKILNSINDFVNREKQELDLGGFLSWLSSIVPSNGIITDIDIKREVLVKNSEDSYSNSEKTAQYPKYQQGKSGFLVKLRLRIDGSYVRAKSSAKKFLEDLSKKVKPKNSKFKYDKKINGAIFYTQFDVKGRV